MKKSEKILKLADEILVDITDQRLPLHNILLKASRLSLLLDIPKNVELFKEWAIFAEQNSFTVSSFESSMAAAADPSISSSNSSQYVSGNGLERAGIRNNTTKVVSFLAKYRAETYNFVMGISTKWHFGALSESIFEKKRLRTEPVLKKIFPDINQRLNSIESNIQSDNDEDWKSAAVSCRTLLMEIADVLNPSTDPSDKDKYLNRLKDFISKKQDISSTGKKLIVSNLEDLKKRIEYTSDLTQGPAHRERPTREETENIILYTYLCISDLMELYQKRNSITADEILDSSTPQ